MENTRHPLHRVDGRFIDGIHLDTEKKQIVSANIIEVEVGTTGHCGGDTGHGGRTLFRISDLASTDMRLSFHAQEGNIEIGDLMMRGLNGTAGFDLEAESIEIVFGGDCELDTFIEALEFALDVLKKKAENK